MQIDLAMWTDRYKNIMDMDMEDRPPQEVIEEDKKLDKYLENLVRKRQKERAELRENG